MVNDKKLIDDFYDVIKNNKNIDKNILIDYLGRRGKYLLDSIYYQRRLMFNFVNNRLLLNKGFIYFATFTLNDNKLNNFNKSSFTKYLRRNNIDFILVNDYGKVNNRLHFHGFVYSLVELNNDMLNLYGFVNFVKLDLNDYEKSIYYCVKYSIKFNFGSMPLLYSYRLFKQEKRSH